MEKLREEYTKAGQEHVFQFWDSLDDDQKAELESQLQNIDLQECISFYDKFASADPEQEDLSKKMHPIEENWSGSSVTSDLEYLRKLFKLGLEKIANGEVGVILLAGGQGTRLGVSYPKGQFDVGLVSGKSLFQLQAERILRLQNLAERIFQERGRINWYIMTSAATRPATEEFFERNAYFCLDPAQVTFFDQGVLPCFTFERKLIMASKHSLAMAPDGNGGIYRALGKSGVLDEMKEAGIKYVHVYCVDNVLVRVADPFFIGFCVSKGADCGAKVVERKDPLEPVGVVCNVDGIGPKVLEYSEISSEIAKLPDPLLPAKLKFRAGNICNHFFTTEFLRNVVGVHERELIHHVAKKKIPTVDENGVPVSPSTPNGIKMEKFVFDVFQFSK